MTRLVLFLTFLILGTIVCYYSPFGCILIWGAGMSIGNNGEYVIAYFLGSLVIAIFSIAIYHLVMYGFYC